MLTAHYATLYLVASDIRTSDRTSKCMLPARTRFRIALRCLLLNLEPSGALDAGRSSDAL